MSSNLKGEDKLLQAGGIIAGDSEIEWNEKLWDEHLEGLLKVSR